MTKTLVIVAHPDLEHSRINATWIDAISGLAEVTVHDLYEKYPSRILDIEFEQGLVDEHDRIVLQFPFQWYSCPPLLKQWLDDVFTSGWAYGPGGHALEGKTLAIAVSTFSRAADYHRDSRYGRSIEDLTSPFEVTALRVGMRYQPGFFLHSSSDYSDIELSENAQQYREFIAKQQ